MSETVRLETSGGRYVEVQVPPPAPDWPSVFVFALHKAGSVLLDNIVIDLCAAAGLPNVSIDSLCFNYNIPVEQLTPASAAELMNRPGYCFRGFRGVHPFLQSVDLASRRKIVLVRDPRDILTSYYFSMAKSHPLPSAPGAVRDTLVTMRDAAAQTSIDEYVTSPLVKFIELNYRAFIALDGENTRTYRYEDVIFNKRDWVADIAGWLSIELSAEEIDRIAAKHDVRPEDENPDRHIRQVTPGNYKKHLKPETMTILNHQYMEILIRFDYVY